jgi:hypothetical protein
VHGDATASDDVKAPLAWIAAALAAAVLAAMALAAHGRASRTAFDPAQAGGSRWVAVTDAGAALRVLYATGVRGRRALVLTGRWARPRSAVTSPDEALSTLTGPRDPAAESTDAFFTLVHVGLARALDVVLPPNVFDLRLAEVAGRKEFQRVGGGFAQPFHALDRRFWTPRALVPPAEPVIVVVEPSFFGPGSPADVPGWLALRGVTYDLAVVALDDPAAQPLQRTAARALADSTRAPLLEVSP